MGVNLARKWDEKRVRSEMGVRHLFRGFVVRLVRASPERKGPDTNFAVHTLPDFAGTVPPGVLGLDFVRSFI